MNQGGNVSPMTVHSLSHMSDSDVCSICPTGLVTAPTVNRPSCRPLAPSKTPPPAPEAWAPPPPYICPPPLWQLTLNTFRNSAPEFLLQKQNISQAPWWSLVQISILRSQMLHLAASLLLANLNKNNPNLSSLSLLYIQKHSKTGPRSNGYHKSCCFVSKYCPWKKSGKNRQIFSPLLYFSLVTYHANISALTKVPNISVPVVCGGCRQYICVYFTCLSLLCSALLSLFTTFGEKLLSLSMLGSSPPHPPSLVNV